MAVGRIVMVTHPLARSPVVVVLVSEHCPHLGDVNSGEQPKEPRASSPATAEQTRRVVSQALSKIRFDRSERASQAHMSTNTMCTHPR